MLFQCWAGVVDSGPTLKQHWVNVSLPTVCIMLAKAGPGAVVKSACLKPALNHSLAFKCQTNKIFLPRSLVMIQYCGEPP